MKDFILLVRVPLSYTPEQAKTNTPKWTALVDQWKKDSLYVTSFVFPEESYVVSGTGRDVRNEAVVCNDLRTVSTIVLRAESLEAAVDLAKSAPVLDYGGSVEVRQVQPRAAR